MSDSQTQRKNTHNGSSKWLRALVVLVVLLGAYGGYRMVLRMRVNARLDAIRAKDEPVTWEELDAWYTLPAGVDNAADVMETAFEQYAQWDDEKADALPVVGDAELPALTEPLNDETKSLIVEYLADNAQALELLHEAANIEQCRFPTDFTQGFNILMQALGPVRTGARLLQLEALIDIENHQGDAAIDSIEAILGVARSLRNEPFIISQLVCMGCKIMAAQTTERAMNRMDFSKTQLRRLKTLFAGYRGDSTLSKAFISERCFGAMAYRMPIDEIAGPIGRPPAVVALYRLTGLAEMDTLVYLDLMAAYRDACRLPMPERQKAAQAVEEKLQNISKIHLISRGLMPALSRAVTLELMHIAELSTARTAIAVQRFGQANGHYPVTLDELIPDYLDAVPVDPFDGQALRYKMVDEGFVVYSVGEDGEDQGGKKRDRSKKYTEDAYDVAFWMERSLGQKSTTN